ncbi:B-cell receptor CD22-like [Toxotes jaculatrix]|uniref:B-cell receptor CD22-like n=1 Tax=Toxotes jaculatrix TaxID=941984 RepID=UPI001B3AB1EA|nr:B-cell receptor CD22-like [Toxotes jaculatrix]
MYWSEWQSGLPGTTLTVTEPRVQVQVIWSSTGPKLICNSSCLLPGRSSFVWYENGNIIMGETSHSLRRLFDPEDSFSCAYEGYRSPPVYAPRVPTVWVSPPGDIMKYSSVTLNCSSDANSPTVYTWYKNNQSLLRKEPQLVFSSIQSSDSGQYYCTAENDLGRRTSNFIFINVKYGPQTSTLSVSPSGEIVEGSSVTLTCSSDANPAADYTWYKENQTLLQGPEDIYNFSSIRSEDRGFYQCKSENQYGQISSEPLFLDVQYAPKLPSVSVSPSAEIKEGSSVNLTCSSDANPAANYTWYKKDEDSAKASGQIFTITNIRAEHSGSYYCEAQNSRGRHSSTFHLTVRGSSVTLTCSSDANPAANYTWYKENQTLLQGPEDIYHFSSISSEDRGTYYCRSVNQHGRSVSSPLFIEVYYAPKLPSVSVSPSAEIKEGSSVNLTCSSDANPAANYTWYKEDEDSAKASGQIFIITNIRAEHSGSYYCEAQNSRGRNNSTFHLTVRASSVKSAAAGSVAVIFLALIFLCAFVLFRRKKFLKQPPEPGEGPDNTAQQQDELFYASVSFSTNRQPNRHKTEEEEEDEEGVEYTVVNVKSATATPGLRRGEAVEDSFALYSTVSKKRRESAQQQSAVCL